MTPEDRVNNFFVKRAIVIIILSLIAIAGWFLYSAYQTSQIDSFEKCAKAGYPIMESYPEQCRANNQTFTKQY